MKEIPSKDKCNDFYNTDNIRFKKVDKYNKRLADNNKADGDILHRSKLNRIEISATSSTTSFCSCSNGIKPAVSTTTIDAPQSIFRNNIPNTNPHLSLGCQTNLGKDITIELAVYHGDTKVVSENFEFPNSSVTDKTVISGNAFEIYCEIVNEEMLQIWGVEKNSNEKNDSSLKPVEFRQSIQYAAGIKHENFLKNLRYDTGDKRLCALIHWAKAQTEKCKSAILEKYDEIWKMLDKVTGEALDEVAAKESELMQLIEEVAELEIKVTDYNDTL